MMNFSCWKSLTNLLIQQVESPETVLSMLQSNAEAEGLFPSGAKLFVLFNGTSIIEGYSADDSDVALALLSVVDAMRVGDAQLVLHCIDETLQARRAWRALMYVIDEKLAKEEQDDICNSSRS